MQKHSLKYRTIRLILVALLVSFFALLYSVAVSAEDVSSSEPESSSSISEPESSEPETEPLTTEEETTETPDYTELLQVISAGIWVLVGVKVGCTIAEIVAIKL